MDWMFGFSQSSYVEALIPRLAILGQGASEQVIQVKWGHKGGAWFNRISVFIRRHTRELAHSLPFCVHRGEKPREDLARRRHISKPGRESSPEIQWARILSSASESLQNFEKINFWFLSHPVCGVCVSAWALPLFNGDCPNNRTESFNLFLTLPNAMLSETGCFRNAFWNIIMVLEKKKKNPMTIITIIFYKHWWCYKPRHHFYKQRIFLLI